MNQLEVACTTTWQIVGSLTSVVMRLWWLAFGLLVLGLLGWYLSMVVTKQVDLSSLWVACNLLHVLGSGFA